MKNKIIIVGVSPLVKRRADVFYVDPLRERGFEVEHCNLSPCIYNLTRYSDIIDAPYALTFSQLCEFEEYLKKQDIARTIFIVELIRSVQLQPIFTLLRKHECFCVRINPNASDMSDRHPSIINGLVKGCYGIKYLMKYPLRLLKSYISKRCIDRFDYEIWKCYISSGNNKQIDFHINQDDWLKSKGEIKEVEGLPQKYAVFCDEYFPYHPDNEQFGLVDKNKVDEIGARYYKLMKDYFDFIEREYNLEVVIAAHPKSNYHGDEFAGRRIIKFKTMELVRHAEFVMLHGSMSIAYSVIFNKPVALTIVPDIKKIFPYFEHQVFYSQYFQLPLYDLSIDLEARPQLVKPELREKYIYEYMTSKGIEDKKNIDLLEELFSKEIPFQ